MDEVSTAPGRPRRGSALVPVLKTSPPRTADGEAWEGDHLQQTFPSAWVSAACGTQKDLDLDLGSHSPREHEEQETETSVGS